MSDISINPSLAQHASHEIQHYNNVLFNEFNNKIAQGVLNLRNNWKSGVCEYSINKFYKVLPLNENRFNAVDIHCRYLCEIVGGFYINNEIKTTSLTSSWK